MDFWGFLIMIEMPSDMKGLEKSMTSSRTNVMVKGATAISAFCGGKRRIHQLTSAASPRHITRQEIAAEKRWWSTHHSHGDVRASRVLKDGTPSGGQKCLQLRIERWAAPEVRVSSNQITVDDPLHPPGSSSISARSLTEVNSTFFRGSQNKGLHS